MPYSTGDLIDRKAKGLRSLLCAMQKYELFCLPSDANEINVN